MIDYFTLALTHALIAIALWRLLFRSELDEEEGGAGAPRRPWARGRAPDEGRDGA